MPLRSNVENWKRLQERGYFESHPCYEGLQPDREDSFTPVIEQFVTLSPDMDVAVIGCGFGRETAFIAPRVRHVWGIDVSDVILDKTRRFLADLDIGNFTGVPYDDYKADVPAGLDLVFSIVVMQHLTRDYFSTFAGKLRPGGHAVVQFVEELVDGVEHADAELLDHEPSISWTRRQIANLAETSGFALQQIDTLQVTPTALWHWAHMRTPGEESAR